MLLVRTRRSSASFERPSVSQVVYIDPPYRKHVLNLVGENCESVLCCPQSTAASGEALAFFPEIPQPSSG